MIRLRVFGPIELRTDEGRELTPILAQPKRLALLVYLAATRSFHRRDALLALFWPELDRAHARAALNSALFFLRRELTGAEQVVVSRADEVGVDASALTCDACVFRDAIQTGQNDDALELYRGAFLEGFFSESGPDFEQWIERERARLRAMAAGAARARTANAERSGDFSTALDSARRAVELSDSDERVVRELLDLLDRAGDRAGAIEAYEAFARELAADYNAAPAAETAALIERIRRRSATSEHGDAATTASAPVLGGERPTPVAESMQPRMRRSWPRLAVGGGVVAIVTVILAARQRVAPSLAVESIHVVSAAPELEVDPAISPNGQLVAYAAGALGNMRILVRQIDGGPPMPVSASLEGDHRWPQWSPDGTQILFVDRSFPAGGNAYVVPYTGGTPRRVISGTGPHGVVTPVWSPDGKRIVYSSGDTLIMHSLETGASTPVVSGAQIHAPAFSPDGRYLAYVLGNWASYSFVLAASRVAMIDLRTGRRIRVSDSTHQNRSPQWTPDGASLLYVSDAGGGRDVFQQRLDGNGAPIGTPTRLTTGSNAWSVTISADGQRAAYSVYRRRSRLWMAVIPPRDTIVPTTLTPVTREAEWIEQVDVSPDGKWLAFDSDRSGHQEIYKTRIEGGEPVRLTFDSAAGFAPAWSPDSREIAYHSFASGVRQLHVMSADGTDNHAVTDDSVHKIRPSWSPDGRALTFNCRWSLNWERACITTREGQRWSRWRELPTGSGAARFPRWSRDGRWIAYLSGRLDSRDLNQLWLYPVNGGAPRRLAGSAELYGQVQYYQWGADASAIFVRSSRAPRGDSDRTGEFSFWSIPLSGDPPRRILTLAEPPGFGFTTDGRRLFFPRVVEEGDIGMLSLGGHRATGRVRQ